MMTAIVAVITKTLLSSELIRYKDESNSTTKFKQLLINYLQKP